LHGSVSAERIKVKRGGKDTQSGVDRHLSRPGTKNPARKVKFPGEWGSKTREPGPERNPQKRKGDQGVELIKKKEERGREKNWWGKE